MITITANIDIVNLIRRKRCARFVDRQRDRLQNSLEERDDLNVRYFLFKSYFHRIGHKVSYRLLPR